jgi:hypothetical protein
MVTESSSMDMDALQAKPQETSNIAWCALFTLGAFASSMTAAEYLASLPTSPVGLASGSLWVNAASNQLGFVP